GRLHQLSVVVQAESALRALRVRARLAEARLRRKGSVPTHAGPAERRPEPAAGLQAFACDARLHVGIDALPVVQIEEHRRAGGGRFEQIVEAPQRTRTDDVALVFGEVDLGRSLAGARVEVVEPE